MSEQSERLKGRLHANFIEGWLACGELGLSVDDAFDEEVAPAVLALEEEVARLTEDNEKWGRLANERGRELMQYQAHEREQVRKLRGALELIAADDAHVEDSGGAWGLQAFHRCQEHARWALADSEATGGPYGGSGPTAERHREMAAAIESIEDEDDDSGTWFRPGLVGADE